MKNHYELRVCLALSTRASVYLQRQHDHPEGEGEVGTKYIPPPPLITSDSVSVLVALLPPPSCEKKKLLICTHKIPSYPRNYKQT